jgi:hypothetical protein
MNGLFALEEKAAGATHPCSDQLSQNLARKNDLRRKASPSRRSKVPNLASLQHFLEHRPEVAGRGADDAQHIGGRGLLFSRFRQFAGKRADLLLQIGNGGISARGRWRAAALRPRRLAVQCFRRFPAYCATPSHVALSVADGVSLSHGQGCCAAQQNCAAHVRVGSIVRITASQYWLPLHFSEQTSPVDRAKRRRREAGADNRFVLMDFIMPDRPRGTDGAWRGTRA